MESKNTRKFKKSEILSIFFSADDIFTIGKKDRTLFDIFLGNTIDQINSMIEPIQTVDESYNDIEYKQEYNASCKLLVYSFPFCCVVPVDPDTRLFITDSDKFDYYISPVPLLENSEWNRTLPYIKFNKLIERLKTEIGKNCIETYLPVNEIQYCLIPNIHISSDKNTGKLIAADNICLWCREPVTNNKAVIKHNNRLYCSNHCKERSIDIENVYKQIVETTNKYNELVTAGKQSDADKLKNNGVYSCCIDYVENTIKKEINNKTKFITYKRRINPNVLNDLYNWCGPSADFEFFLYDGRCKFCGKPLPPNKNKGSQYCCNRCRSKAGIKRNKEKKND